jgi:precorrin-6B methylase 2
MFELASTRIFPLWCGLADLLKTGKPQNEEKDGVGLWQYLAKDLAQLKRFMSAMTGVTLGDAILIAAKFPWHKYKTFVDVGAAQGALPVRVALAHPHLTGGSYDLPFVREIFEEYVAQFGLSDRLHFYPGDMKAGPLPTADVLSFGHLLHGEGVPERKALMTKAFAAINAGGALIVYDAMIDDERTKVMGFMSSLNIMLETWLGFESTVGQSAAWLREAGFVDIQVEPLFGPTTMVWGTKP